jgi:hypothetical protein
MVCIAERIRLLGENDIPLGFMVLNGDHYEWEPDKGPYLYPAASLQTIANGIDEYNQKLKEQKKIGR